MTIRKSTKEAMAGIVLGIFGGLALATFLECPERRARAERFLQKIFRRLKD